MVVKVEGSMVAAAVIYFGMAVSVSPNYMLSVNWRFTHNAIRPRDHCTSTRPIVWPLYFAGCW